jgi:hypothetical protein
MIAETLVKLGGLAGPDPETNDWTKSGKTRSLAKWNDLSVKEVSDVFLKAKNGAPGRDKITTDLFKELDPDMRRVAYLVNKDLGEGRASLKEAELVLVPKQGRDTSTAKGWRPITLLLINGKGLKRALARWLGETGLARGWFGENQAGGIPGRSTTDVALRILADLEMKQEGVNRHKAWKTLVCIDIKGAFNAAKKDFIYKILRDKGVPNNIVRLVVDFISDRTVYPRRGRVKGSSIHLDDGFP